MVDHRLNPRRLQRAFDRHLSPRSEVAVYAAFGLGLAAAALLQRGRRRGR